MRHDLSIRPHRGLRQSAWALVATASLVLACSTAAVLGQQKSASKRAQPAAKGHGHGSHGKHAVPGVNSLDVYTAGTRIHILVGERQHGQEPQLSYRASSDAGETWSPPVAVGKGQAGPVVRRGADAQVAAAGDRLVAIWATGGKDLNGRGPLATAVSSDGGKTWEPGPNPSEDGSATDHPLPDVTVDEGGTFHAVWIGGRADESSHDKGLRYARSTDGGLSWSANMTLDEQCCECCWNSIRTSPGGGVQVLYRNRGPRDMAFVASRDGGKTWDEPVTVGAFGWGIEGCPHVGGGLAGAADADDRTLFATVWTAKGAPHLGVFALASPDGGRSWGKPVQLGGPQSNRPDVAFAAGRAVAVWDESDEDGGNAAFAASSTNGGATWAKATRLSEPGASATNPRVIRTGDTFRVFWTEQRPGKPVSWTSRLLK